MCTSAVKKKKKMAIFNKFHYSNPVCKNKYLSLYMMGTYIKHILLYNSMDDDADKEVEENVKKISTP